jgi:hypothetical protein
MSGGRCVPVGWSEERPVKGWHRLVLIVLAVVAAVAIMVANEPSLDLSTCTVDGRQCTVPELHDRYEAGNRRGLLLGVIPIGVVLLVLLGEGLLLVAVSQRRAEDPAGEALLDALIPPEVRSVRPDARAADARPRGIAGPMALIMVLAVSLPFIAVIGQEVVGLDAGSGVLDEVITGVLVAGGALSAVLIARSRRQATTRVDLLGLAADAVPIPVGDVGAHRAHVLLHGRRHGRQVTVAQLPSGHIITVGAAVDGHLDARADGGPWGGQAPVAVQQVLAAAAADPGTATLTSDGTTLTLQRELRTADTIDTGGLALLRDLQLVEAVAFHAASPAQQLR